MKRRSALWASALAPLAPLMAGRAWAGPDAEAGMQRLATAWQVPGTSAPDSGFRVGVLDIAWSAGRVQLRAQQSVPTRAHGLLPLADGGFVAVANRPGRWLLRCDAGGAVMQRLDTAAEKPQRSFNGHVEAIASPGPGGEIRWLCTSETDPDTGVGWLSLRDARTLQRVAQFESAGIDPHQLRQATDGALLVANGGIVRDALGRKIEAERMAPSLARIDPASGRLLGRWTLADPQLSIRHIAWASGPDPLLGLALQAEHADPAQRAAAPSLALWNGKVLVLPCPDRSAGGYVGDIAAGPGGGFVISAQKQGRGLWWHPAAPEQLTLIAQLTEPCALVPEPDGAGVAISAASGAARWHATEAPRMLPWPVPMAPDNHWVLLAAA